MTADVKTLYAMTRALSQQLDAALAAKSSGDSPDFMPFGGYALYAGEYNRLLAIATEVLGGEIGTIFQTLDFKDQSSPGAASGILWKPYTQLVASRVAQLAAVLQSRLGGTDEQIEAMLDLLKLNLRAALFQPPEKEVDVQNALEIIFRARNLDFRREKIVIEYSTKRFVPDFTFESLNLTVEVKLSNDKRREKEIIDEINADIVAYKTRYQRLIFVVFDLGHIRDVGTFIGSIEANPDVHVVVVKW